MAANLLEVPLDDALFRVLSSESRREILRLLQKRRMTGTELAQSLDLGKPAVSEHLKKLHDAGLVVRHDDPERRWVYFSLSEHGRTLLEPRRTRFILVLSVAVAALLLGAVLGAALMGMAPSSTTGDLGPDGSAAGSGGLGATGMDVLDAVDVLPDGNGTHYMFRAEDIDIQNRTILADVYLVVRDDERAAFYTASDIDLDLSERQRPAAEGQDAGAAVPDDGLDGAADGDVNGTDGAAGTTGGQVIPGTIVHVTTGVGGSTAGGDATSGVADGTNDTATADVPDPAIPCPAPTAGTDTVNATAGTVVSGDEDGGDAGTNVSTATAPSVNETITDPTTAVQDTTSGESLDKELVADVTTTSAASGTTTATSTATPTAAPASTAETVANETGAASTGNETVSSCPAEGDAAAGSNATAPADMEVNETDDLPVDASTEGALDSDPVQPANQTPAPEVAVDADLPPEPNGTGTTGSDPAPEEDAMADEPAVEENGTSATDPGPGTHQSPPAQDPTDNASIDPPTDAAVDVQPTTATSQASRAPAPAPSATASGTPTPDGSTSWQDGAGTAVDRTGTLQTAPNEDAPAVRQDGDAWLQPLLLTLLGLFLIGAWVRNRRP